MYLSYDESVDAMYLRIKKARVAKTVEVREDVILDLDARGRLIGIEILDVSDKASLKDIANVNVLMPLKAAA